MANGKVRVAIRKGDIEVTKKEIVEYYKKEFEDKWKDFIRDELGEYEIRKILYYKKDDFFLLKERNRYIKIKITNDEFKEKLIKISEEVGK